MPGEELGVVAAGLFEEGVDAVVPVGQIGRGEGVLGGAGEYEVADLEGADGPVF